MRAAATTAATTALLRSALAGPALRSLAAAMAALSHPAADAVAASTYRFIGRSPDVSLTDVERRRDSPFGSSYAVRFVVNHADIGANMTGAHTPPHAAELFATLDVAH